MTKEELITKQQLQIEEYKEMLEENSNIIKSLIGKFYNIGQPLNDNILNFNKEQHKWCFEVVELIEELNSLKKSRDVSDENLKNISLKLFTEEEVSKLLTTQKGNCYVAILSKTKDQELAKVAAMAPEPWNWNDREK